MMRTQAYWLLATLLLSFALAGCASKGTPSAPGAAASASAREATPQSTPPGSAAPADTQAATGGATASAPAAGGGSEAQRSGGMTTPLGERVEIRASWVQVRNQPSPDAKAIALAFGNDTLPVLETKGDWVRVRVDKNREGWIPVSATQNR